ncbi:hypothetical protein PYCCODRAFT_1463032 [Trametes coccinea BRFM310]|uniref:Uncharacterized protein n=1 Tax=Trametes coccinea (strain BRFM310) TaxID=1353009 RepID=A0A1Y2J2R9_TRAC3|nr:hypothetical protein PYCCODRAFT_1463032 [Trametes coccinea BRFM310]
MHATTSHKLVLDDTQDVDPAGPSSSVLSHEPEEQWATGDGSSGQLPEIAQAGSPYQSEHDLDDYLSVFSSTTSETESAPSPQYGGQIELLNTPFGVSCLTALSSNYQTTYNQLSSSYSGWPALQSQTFPEAEEGQSSGAASPVVAEDAEEVQSTQGTQKDVATEACPIEPTGRPVPEPSMTAASGSQSRSNKRRHIEITDEHEHAGFSQGATMSNEEDMPVAGPSRLAKRSRREDSQSRSGTPPLTPLPASRRRPSHPPVSPHPPAAALAPSLLPHQLSAILVSVKWTTAVHTPLPATYRWIRNI